MLYFPNRNMKVEFQRDPSISQLPEPCDLGHLALKNTQAAFKNKTSKGFRKPPNNNSELRVLIKKNKVKRIEEEFLRKVRRLAPLHSIPKPITTLANDSITKWDLLCSKLEETEGMKVGEVFSIVWNFLNLFHLLIMTFILSFCLAFEKEKQNNQTLGLISQFSLLFIVVEIILNSVSQRFEKGSNLKNIKEIFTFYLKADFWLDLAYLVSILCFFEVQQKCLEFLFVVFVLVKLVKALSKTQNFSYIYLANIFREKYYQVIKAIFFNFLIGHAIAIALILMTQLNPNHNWFTQNGLQNETSVNQYIWSYYWGANIMLTVGFGDFAATTASEALVLIFVETFSCIMLAYNINTVGSILTEINEKENERKAQLKIFFKMSQENNIPIELTKEIMNFIDQSFEIKEKFLYEKHDEIINKLPKNIKSEYKKQAYKSLFDQLPFVNMLSKKSQMRLAQKIQRKIAHPEELIRKRGQVCKLTILSTGEIGLSCSGSGKKLNGKLIHTYKVSQKDKSQLLSLKFLKNRVYEYDVKSLAYSIIYQFSYEELKEALKDYPYDYQLLCELRDKEQNYLGDNQIQNCEVCLNERHLYFDCPKIHYIPSKNHVIRKNRWGNIERKQKRGSRSRSRNPVSVLKTYNDFSEQYLEFLHHFYGVERVKKIQAQAQNILRTQEKSQSARKSARESVMEVQMRISKLPSFDLYNNFRCMLQENKRQVDLCSGYWNIECDFAHIFGHYMRNFNADQIGPNL